MQGELLSPPKSYNFADELVGQVMITKEKNEMGWPCKKFEKWRIYKHETLPSCKMKTKNNKIIGYIFGWARKEKEIITGNEKYVLDKKIENIPWGRVESLMYSMGGRWTSVFSLKEGEKVYVDPMSYFSMCYSPPTKTVASTTSIIPKNTKNEVQKELLKKFEIPYKNN